MKNHQMNQEHSISQHERIKSRRSDIELLLEQMRIKTGLRRIDFKLLAKDGRSLRPEDLGIQHRQLLHVIIFDDALEEFFHVHPDFGNGIWHVTIPLHTSGHYSVWVQGILKNDGLDFSAHSEMAAEGEEPPHVKSIPDSSRLTGQTKSSIIDAHLSAGSNIHMIKLNFRRNDSLKPQLSNYLGALAHVIGVSAKTGSLVHLHPMDNEIPNELIVHAEFPEPGMYRLWVEFIDHGELLNVPLWIEV